MPCCLSKNGGPEGEGGKKRQSTGIRMKTLKKRRFLYKRARFLVAACAMENIQLAIWGDQGSRGRSPLSRRRWGKKYCLKEKFHD